MAPKDARRMSVAELRTALEERGLSTDGLKGALAARLQNARDVDTLKEEEERKNQRVDQEEVVDVDAEAADAETTHKPKAKDEAAPAEKLKKNKKKKKKSKENSKETPELIEIPDEEAPVPIDVEKAEKMARREARKAAKKRKKLEEEQAEAKAAKKARKKARKKERKEKRKADEEAAIEAALAVKPPKKSKKKSKDKSKDKNKEPVPVKCSASVAWFANTLKASPQAILAQNVPFAEALRTGREDLNAAVGHLHNAEKATKHMRGTVENLSAQAKAQNEMNGLASGGSKSQSGSGGGSNGDGGASHQDVDSASFAKGSNTKCKKTTEIIGTFREIKESGHDQKEAARNG